MNYRRVGATDLVVSEIGFGCGGNAGLMVSGPADEQRRVVARALELGVTYFDTAPDYGDGAAEANLGRVLRELGARPVINTKVEIRAEDLDDIAGHIVRSTEASLRRLGRDAVDVLQIHNGPSTARPVLAGRTYKSLALEDYLRPGGVLDGLDRVLRDGKARQLGFICRGNDIDAVGRLMDTGLFRLLNVPYTLLNPTAGQAKPAGLAVDPDYGDVIGRARAAGVGIAVFSPLAGGLLTDAILAGRQTHPLARPKDTGSLEERGALRLARAFQAVAATAGMSLIDLAYGFVLAHPGVSTVLGGISSVEQIEGIVAAAARGLPAATAARIAPVWSA